MSPLCFLLIIIFFLVFLNVCSLCYTFLLCLRLLSFYFRVIYFPLYFSFNFHVSSWLIRNIAAFPFSPYFSILLFHLDTLVYTLDISHFHFFFILVVLIWTFHCCHLFPSVIDCSVIYLFILCALPFFYSVFIVYIYPPSSVSLFSFPDIFVSFYSLFITFIQIFTLVLLFFNFVNFYSLMVSFFFFPLCFPNPTVRNF